MDVVAVDAFAAFIIVYTLFIVVVLPINSFVEPLVSPLGHSDKLVGLSLSLDHSDKLGGPPLFTLVLPIRFTR
jgi:hypothetical protein